MAILGIGKETADSIKKVLHREYGEWGREVIHGFMEKVALELF